MQSTVITSFGTEPATATADYHPWDGVAVLRRPCSASVHSWGVGHGAAPYLLFPTLSPSWDLGRGGLSVSIIVTAPSCLPISWSPASCCQVAFSGARWLLWNVHRFWHKHSELKAERQAHWVPEQWDQCNCMWCVKSHSSSAERTVKGQVMEPRWVSPLHSLLSGTLVLAAL